MARKFPAWVARKALEGEFVELAEDGVEGFGGLPGARASSAALTTPEISATNVSVMIHAPLLRTYYET
jgi:hypothetical protein